MTVGALRTGNKYSVHKCSLRAFEVQVVYTAEGFVDVGFRRGRQVSIGVGANRGGEEVEGQDVLRGS